jgi:hypothetical protein
MLLRGLDGTRELFRPLLRVLSVDVRSRVITLTGDCVSSYAELRRVVEERLADKWALVLVASRGNRTRQKGHC